MARVVFEGSFWKKKYDNHVEKLIKSVKDELNVCSIFKNNDLVYTYAYSSVLLLLLEDYTKLHF